MISISHIYDILISKDRKTKPCLSIVLSHLQSNGYKKDKIFVIFFCPKIFKRRNFDFLPRNLQTKSIVCRSFCLSNFLETSLLNDHKESMVSQVLVVSFSTVLYSTMSILCTVPNDTVTVPLRYRYRYRYGTVIKFSLKKYTTVTN